MNLAKIILEVRPAVRSRSGAVERDLAGAGYR